MFKRRIGPDPHADGGPGTANASGCPDIWELEDGSFAVIGLDVTAKLRGLLPVGASCGPDEQIVILPRSTLTNAKLDIPSE